MPIPILIALGLAGTGGAVGLGYGVGRSTEKALTLISVAAGAYFLFTVIKR